MLDYAANAKTSFSAERMAAWLEASAARDGRTAPEVLAETLLIDDVPQFWETVATNLDAERFRLVFVSDKIGSELRRIIEFLNGQMGRTEVLAIEVAQYVDEVGHHQTIVPRVIGNTEEAKRTKRRGSSSSIDRSALLSALSDIDARSVEAAQELLAWAEGRTDLEVRWNRAGDIGLVSRRSLLRIWGEGTLELKVNSLRHVDETWDEDDRIEGCSRA